MKCWLCDGTGWAPGELIKDIFGDNICIYCDAKIKGVADMLTHPEAIPIAAEISKLAKALPDADEIRLQVKYDKSGERDADL